MAATADASSIPSGWRTRQPGMALYLLFFAVPGMLLRALFYSVLYAWSGRRPCPRWTYRQALTTRLMAMAMQCTADIGYTQSVCLDDEGARKLGDRWVVMDPAPAEVYDGLEATEETGNTEAHPVPPVRPVRPVRPARIGGTWYPGPPQPGEQGLVVLCYHSGSFLWVSGRPDDGCAYPAQLMMQRLKVPSASTTRVFFPQYRLAGDAADPSPWPGPLQDAVTAYWYLTQTLGIAPGRIVLAGDSSGGTMAVGMLRWLEGRTGEAPSAVSEAVQDCSRRPAACLLFSPSVEYAFEGDGAAVDAHPNAATDYISGGMSAWGAAAVASPGDNDNHHHHHRLDSPWLSPGLHPFATAVPVFAHAGGGEVLQDSVRRFVDAMAAIPNNRVRYAETADAPHDVFMVGHLLGWSTQAEAAVDEAGRFLLQSVQGEAGAQAKGEAVQFARTDSMV